MGWYTHQLQGVSRQVAKTLKIPTPVISTSERYIHLLKSLQNKKDLVYPYSWIKLTDTEINRASYPPRHIARKGVYTSRDDNLRTARKIYPIPTILNIEFNLVTDDTEKFFRFIEWYNVRVIVNRLLNFSLVYKGGKFPIVVNPSDQITVPEKTGSSEEPTILHFTTTMQISGFSVDDAEEKDVPLLVYPIHKNVILESPGKGNEP